MSILPFADPVPVEAALAALRRALAEAELLAGAAARIEAETAWRSRAADRYRAAVAEWGEDVRRLTARIEALAAQTREEEEIRSRKGWATG